MSKHATKLQAEASKFKFVSREEIERRHFVHHTKRGWGIWLRRYAWAHFVTLTFARRTGEQGAIRLFMKWICELERLTRREVGWFFVLEWGSGGQLHLHALTTGTENLPPACLEQMWRSGRPLVAAYDKHLGASYYVTKHLGSTILHYDIAPPEKFIGAVLTDRENEGDSDQ